MEINSVFDKYVTALENNKMDMLDEILDKDVLLVSSHLGKVEGLDNVKQALAWKGMDIDISKIRVFNNVIRKNKKEARQSVFLIMLYGKEIDDFLHHFQCGFLYTMKYKFVNNKWKIVEIRCNMNYETGNTLLVANWWKLLDYSAYGGCRFETINKYDHSPWIQIPKTDEKLSDEEAIKQCFYHYNWLIDMTDFNGLLDITTENCYAKETMNNRQDWINMLLTKRPKEVSWAHISTFDSLEIQDDHAKAVIYRYEPNRIGTKFLHKYNINMIYYSSYWNIDFIKEDGKWKMDSFKHTSGVKEINEDWNRRYF